MDKHTLKIKSKTITTWIRDFYDSFSPWYFGFNSTNDSFEINSMIGTQPKWGMYLDSLEDELRLLSDGNYKRVFDEVIEFV